MGGCGSSQQAADKPEKKQKNVFNVADIDLVGEQNDKIANVYTLMTPPLGKGAFGEVRKAIHKITNQPRAVKIISKRQASEEDIEKFKDEVNILKTLDHPNIIKVFEFYQDSKYFYIVTELCAGGELFDKILQEKSFTERRAAETMKQILGAINYCHKKKIVHRDLKPENVLYESKNASSILKVVDFGTSIMFNTDKKMKQKIGTPYYIAPEVLEGNYDEKCDIWSLGVILYIMLCGAPPFTGNDDLEIIKHVRKGEPKFDEEEWAHVSQSAIQFIKSMLEKGDINILITFKDPSQRIDAQQALESQWIQQYCKKQEVDLPQLKKSLENMKNFRNLLKMQEAALLFMINNLASKEEKTELLKQFQSLDVNGDGRLSKEELLNGYKKVMNEVDAEEEVNKIMAQVDKNNSGLIDYSEFVLATFNREALVERQRLEMGFKMLDKDSSGKISIEEIKSIFGHNSQIADSVWNDLVKEVDENSDGLISFDEFKNMMIKITEKQ